MKKKEYYNAKELVEKLRINIMTIYHDIINVRRLKTYKIGKEFRIGKKEFQGFLDKVKTK